MAAEHGAEHAAPSATDYINHHMTHLSVGEGFWSWHVDTLIMSAALALIVMFVLGRAARQATAGVPSRFVAFIEIVFEFIDNLVGEIYHGNRKFLVALAQCARHTGCQVIQAYNDEPTVKISRLSRACSRLPRAEAMAPLYPSGSEIFRSRTGACDRKKAVPTRNQPPRRTGDGV